MHPIPSRTGVTLGALLLAAACAADPGPCPAPRIDARATVARVHDGDTLVLADGRRVRLVGVNTPELGDGARPDEPLAREARDRLSARLPPGSLVDLQVGTVAEDRHGRMLAHVFAPDGADPQRELVAAGLGWALAIGANVGRAGCYFAAEREAREARRGVWGLDAHAPIEADAVSRADGGFHRLRGRVTRIGRSRDNLWVQLGPRAALRIPRAFAGAFPADLERHLLHRRVEARGWIHFRRGEARITVDHPAMLAVLP